MDAAPLPGAPPSGMRASAPVSQGKKKQKKPARQRRPNLSTEDLQIAPGMDAAWPKPAAGRVRFTRARSGVSRRRLNQSAERETEL